MKIAMTDKGLLSIRPVKPDEVYSLKKWTEKWLLDPIGFDKTEDDKEDLVMVSRNGLVVELETGLIE